MARPVGRPRTLNSPEEMLALAEEYFAECAQEKTPYRIEGLALALGMWGRGQLDDYEARSDYSLLVKRLRLAVRDSYERRLSGNTPVGAIFALKNMGWSDRQDIALSTPDGALRIDPGRDRLTDEQLAALIKLAEQSRLTD